MRSVRRLRPTDRADEAVADVAAAVPPPPSRDGRSFRRGSRLVDGRRTTASVLSLTDAKNEPSAGGALGVSFRGGTGRDVGFDPANFGLPPRRPPRGRCLGWTGTGLEGVAAVGVSSAAGAGREAPRARCFGLASPGGAGRDAPRARLALGFADSDVGDLTLADLGLVTLALAGGLGLDLEGPRLRLGGARRWAVPRSI